MITALKKAANMHGRVSLFLQNHPIYKTITPQKKRPIRRFRFKARREIVPV